MLAVKAELLGMESFAHCRNWEMQRSALLAVLDTGSAGRAQ